MPNTNTTKAALGESLKKLVLTKRLEKITINDLTTDCGISRMAFYYHFKDIYDLVEWVCVEDGKKVLQGKKTYETWQEGMSQIFEAVLENKAFVLNVYRSIGREKVEGYLYKLTYEMIKEVVEDRCRGCLLYTSDAADDRISVDLGGRRIIKKIFFFKQKTAYEMLRSSWARRCV